jgi:hypothetical protein
MTFRNKGGVAAGISKSGIWIYVLRGKNIGEASGKDYFLLAEKEEEK